jgi:hypothetical protein
MRWITRRLPAAALLVAACVSAQAAEKFRRLPAREFSEKMKAGWIGQIFGVSWGAPTEGKFKTIIPADKVPPFKEEWVNEAFNQDDLYVEMTFLRTLERYGFDVSIRQAGIDFANSEYRLWVANAAGRSNLRKGIAPPDSSHPKFHPSAGAIDYQIEADYSGLIAPGMFDIPIRLGEKFGRLMNYGDGVYAGQFVGCLYAEAYFETDIVKLIRTALQCIPPQSMYAEMVRDMLKWHSENPTNWEKTWQLVVDKYRHNKNYYVSPLDVKQEGAFALMGLLYGKRDPEQTIVISMRCGSDSDCNPSTAAGVLFTSLGMKNLPERFYRKLDETKVFSYTAYNFPGLLAVSDRLARQALARVGGRIEKQGGQEVFLIPVRPPRPSPFEDLKNPGPVAGSLFTAEERAEIKVQDPPPRPRPLVEEKTADSMMARYLSKPVHEAKLIDDMESDGHWSATGIATIGYTTERAKDGRRSLRFRTSMRDEAHIRANRKNGSFVGGQGGSASARLALNPPQDWSRFNRLSVWVYVHPSLQRAFSFTLQFTCADAPRGTLEPPYSHVVQDLKAGEWNQVVWEIPEFKRDKVTGLAINQTLRGHDPEEEGIVTYDIDRVEIQRVDAEKYEGWEVAPGRIAFQHVGYRPAQEKVAFASGLNVAQFEVVDAATNRAVASFPVRDLQNRRGRFQVLDFTGFTKPGRYLLRAGPTAGRPFAISDELWYGTIEKALNFYYGERCGFDVPGVHRVCHQDWQGTHEGQTKIINGGWHDAGDLSQGSHRTGSSTYSMLHVYDQLRERGVRPDLERRLVEEIRWGLDWLLKTRFGGGYRITWALGRIYTDNKVGTIDDMVVPAQHIAFENFLFSAVAAHAAQTLKEVDPDRAARSLAAAEEDYRATLERRASWTPATREEAAFGALASAELFRATGRQTYAEQAARFGRLLLECQEQRFVDGIPVAGWFYTDTSRQRVVHDFHLSFEDAPLMALRALCDTFPNHADWMEWYAAALLHSEYFYRQGAAASEPFRLVPNSVWSRSEIDALPEKFDRAAALVQFSEATRLSDSHRLRVFPIWRDNLFHGNTAIQLAGTAALTAAAQLRNQPAIAELARRQLAWVFGGNSFSQSLMYGEGYDYQPHFAYCLRDLVGALPVGMDSLHGDSPYWPMANRATYKEIWVVPVSRFLWSAAFEAMPARVAGAAPAGAVFREARTGAEVKVAPGSYALNLPPGDYQVTYGGATRRLALLAGARYRLPLDAGRALDMELSAGRPEAGVVEIRARLGGAGAHRLELRAFNGSPETPVRSVTLTAGRDQTLAWKFKVASADKPWAVVVIPDGDTGGRRELFGTLRELPPIE